MDKNTDIGVKCGKCDMRLVFFHKKSCPFCGSDNLIEETAAKTTPDGIIPFKKDKKHMQKVFNSYIKRHILAPSAVRKAEISGIYIPFRLYDANALATYFGKGGRDRTVKNKDGHQHTSTDWHSVTGFMEKAYYDIPSCAASEAISESTEKILPYNIKNIIPYQERYMEGYSFAAPLNTDTDVFPGAEHKIRKNLKESAKKDINKRGFHYSSIEKIETQFTDIKSREVLFPVWFANAEYNGVSYLYVINGESGKITGKIPVSTAKTVVSGLIFAAVIALSVLLSI